MSAATIRARRLEQTDFRGAHRCHWPGGCARSVAPAFWACRDHWRALPHEIRFAIAAAYRPGQELEEPSIQYLAAFEWAKS